MTPTKFLIGQFLLTLLLLLLSTREATQWTAQQLAFQPRLGTACLTLAEYLSNSPSIGLRRCGAIAQAGLPCLDFDYNFIGVIKGDLHGR